VGWRQQTTIRAFFSHWPTIAGVTTLSRANFAIRVGGDFIVYGESHQPTLFASRKPKYGEDGLLETVETIGGAGVFWHRIEMCDVVTKKSGTVLLRAAVRA
jgi:hypothetical protein